MSVIDGVMKNYDWGAVDGLRTWAMGATSNPQAELWFGDHSSGDSSVIVGDTTLSHFTGGQAPLMLKLIACARPLSIQVHPNAEIAAKGLGGFKADDGSQVLVDGFGKDEMLLALSRFDLLAGFVTESVGFQILHDFGGAFDSAAESYAAGDIANAVAKIMQKPGSAMSRLKNMLPPALVRDLGEGAMSTNDPALVVAALMQRVRLYPGEAIHVPPGTVHAYLGGTGVEVMTTSDNVLRIGLTAKPTAVEAALHVAHFGAVQEIPRKDELGASVFAPKGAPFQLRDLRAGDRTHAFEVPPADYRVVLALEGGCSVMAGDATVECQAGQACAIIGDRYLQGPGREDELGPHVSKALSSRAILVETAGRAVVASHVPVAD